MAWDELPAEGTGEASMLVAKQVADLITIARGLLTLLFIWLGVTQRASALPLACWVLILAWSGDLLDGPIARRSRISYHTWIGDHDLPVDIMVSFGLLMYLLAAGYVDLRLAAVYLLVWALVFWRWGVPQSLGMLVQAPIYGWFLWVALRDAPASGLWVVAWVLALIILTWPRALHEVVPGWLSGMRDVWDQYRRG
jgi:phosphatidylserine synthase